MSNASSAALTPHPAMPDNAAGQVLAIASVEHHMLIPLDIAAKLQPLPLAG